ncbi:MAG: transporter substrate-binding domain-containing protein [Microcystaceae cyanobacterium]
MNCRRINPLRSPRLGAIATSLVLLSLFPGMTVTPPVWARSSPRLKVGVVISPPFVINHPVSPVSPKPLPTASSKSSSPPSAETRFSGIAIDIWQRLATFNQLSYDYYQVSGFDQGITEVAKGNLDVLIGPISITPERLSQVNFTQPYLNSYFSLLVHADPLNLWQLLQPFLHRAVFFSLTGFVLINILFAHLLWLVEHKLNSEQFPQSYWRGVAEALWFVSVTMTTVGYGDKVPITPLGRCLAFLWMWVSLVMTTAITAGLASTLTLFFSQQTNPAPMTSVNLQEMQVATVRGLMLESVLANHNIKAIETPSLSAALNLFFMEEVDAVLSTEHALRFVLEQYPRASLKIVPLYNLPVNYGFAVNLHSPYLTELNISIMQMVQDKAINEIVNQWLQSSTGITNPQTNP